MKHPDSMCLFIALTRQPTADRVGKLPIWEQLDGLAMPRLLDMMAASIFVVDEALMKFSTRRSFPVIVSSTGAVKCPVRPASSKEKCTFASNKQTHTYN
jgi:hypothetical protein